MRLIDADALFDFLTEQLEKETGMYRKGRNDGLNIARSALHDEIITPTMAQPSSPPPNLPLTLEELREMDGEPVWVELICKNSPMFCAIIHRNCVTDGRMSYDTAKTVLSLDRNGAYGVTWLAYRRKPQELRRFA